MNSFQCEVNGSAPPQVSIALEDHYVFLHCQEFTSSVGRAVVDNHDLNINALLLAQGVDDTPRIRQTIEDGNQNVDFWREAHRSDDSSSIKRLSPFPHRSSIRLKTVSIKLASGDEAESMKRRRQRC
ncbi:MAG: hypothetical protein JW384_00095 [Nitrosomonadaceae bacterium]|nr:hypothetical protein [Nitrosomonadaceae bacterium]